MIGLRAFVVFLLVSFSSWGTATRLLSDSCDPRPTHSGYLTVNGTNSSLYYAYYESQRHHMNGKNPILLWLQGGPGCASTFGALYELGPCLVTEGLHTHENPGSWNVHYALLFIDQPIGTGYSPLGEGDKPPTDEMQMASHLYSALQNFFSHHRHLQTRPFFITGESYGGKYVPSLAHYVLQASSGGPTNAPLLRRWRQMPAMVESPLFDLRGIAIGNGLTEPVSQTLVLGEVAYHLGMVAPAVKEKIDQLAEEVVGHIRVEEWEQAQTKRDALLEYIKSTSGAATLLDMRRTSEYDGSKAVDRYLNLPKVQRAMGAKKGICYESCSEAVGESMKSDVMKSVRDLFPDLLDHYQVLLYQGQFDAQDGPASTNAWLKDLQWSHQQEFNELEGRIWYHRGFPVGWWRNHSSLAQVVIRNAGHMVPQDQPEVAQKMIHAWVEAALGEASVGLVA